MDVFGNIPINERDEIKMSLLPESLKLGREWLADEKKKRQVMAQIREMLLRELALNCSLVSEADRLRRASNPGHAKLVKSTHLQGLEMITSSGVPLSEVFDTDWSVREAHAGPIKTGSYSHRLKDIKTLSELVERCYHRLYIERIRAEQEIEKKNSTLPYLVALLVETKSAVAANHPGG